MKNVLVFALAGGRFAVELKWVREVITLGALTPVPTAPSCIAGAINFRGAIVPVLAADAVVPPGSRTRSPRSGDQVILVEVEGIRGAFCADRVDEVTTLVPAEQGGLLRDKRGNLVPLIEPPALVAEVRRRVAAAVTAARHP